jgi:predicted phosphodiesterase
MCRAAALALLASLGCAGCGEATRERAGVFTVEAPLPLPGGLAVPDEPGSVKFAVIGDSGRGTPEQHELGRRMAEYRERFGFDFVIMLGDNIYEGPASPRDYELRFERPYEALLRAGVKFYAALGNHDDPEQRHYAPFNMGGHRYYTFEKTGGLLAGLVRARFFALDTTGLDAAQRAWLSRELSGSEADWKICFFHHPLFTPGRYASWWWRQRLEPLLVANGADVVFSGHDHLYARMKPQRGVQYFVSGGAGSVRVGDFRPSPLAARGYDADLHFMLVEVTRQAVHFQAVNRRGETVDAGVVGRQQGSLGADRHQAPQRRERISSTFAAKAAAHSVTPRGE